MPNWTPEQHADARVWANDRGAKSRALAGALDEIERLQEYAGHTSGCTQFGLWIEDAAHPCTCGWERTNG